MQATVKGKITKITGFGAFVSLPDGSSGMVHISEVSTTFVKDINGVTTYKYAKTKKLFEKLVEFYS